MSTAHENLYIRTIDSFMEAVAKESFTNDALPRLIEGLRKELVQCMELGLISAEFYTERMAKLDCAIKLEV